MACSRSVSISALSFASALSRAAATPAKARDDRPISCSSDGSKAGSARLITSAIIEKHRVTRPGRPGGRPGQSVESPENIATNLLPIRPTPRLPPGASASGARTVRAAGATRGRTRRGGKDTPDEQPLAVSISEDERYGARRAQAKEPRFVGHALDGAQPQLRESEDGARDALGLPPVHAAKILFGCRMPLG